MKISFLCSDPQHPVNDRLLMWIEQQQSAHQIELVRTKRDLTAGDILFLISCSEIISAEDRARYRASLVLHASDLPTGRGWSPHIWEILAGAEEITLSLLEAEDKVDSGQIWAKSKIPIPKHALWDEINSLLLDAEIKLIEFTLKQFDNIEPQPQDLSIEPSYYPRRTPANSQLDPMLSLVELFDNIRLCDPNRYPAFFIMRGKKYKITLEKIDD